MKSVLAGTVLMVLISAVAAVILSGYESSSSQAYTSPNGSVRLDSH